MSEKIKPESRIDSQFQAFDNAKRLVRNVDRAGVAHFGIYADPAADHPMFNIPGNFTERSANK